MKLLKNINHNSKRGATSIFIALIMIVVLTLIVIGFSRLMISEAIQTSNNDLSQSAYDSALAGIEDARVAILKYHQCLSEGYTYDDIADTDCRKIIRNMQNGIKNQDCDTVNKVLGRSSDTGADSPTDKHGTIIQETQSVSDGGVASEMVQAYTCVTIEEELADYRTTLGTDGRTRIVPLRSDQVQNIDHIELYWYSSVNAAAHADTPLNLDTNLNLYPLGHVQDNGQPPVIGFNIFQANEVFSLSQLSTAAGENNTDHSMLYLKPVNDSSAYSLTKAIEASVLGLAADKNKNDPTPVNCQPAAGTPDVTFYCKVRINLPQPYLDGKRNEGATFFFITLPYGYPETDISVKLFNSANKLKKFTSVQARVDSTGRANDLYRRIEARLELVDTYFPYPEFTIQMNDGAGSDIRKTFHVTGNCWESQNGEPKDYSCNEFEDNDNYSYF